MLWVELDRFCHAYIYLGLAISNPWQLKMECMRMELAGLPGKKRAEPVRQPSG